MDIRKYNNSYEIKLIQGRKPAAGVILDERPMAKCQAVRIKEDWFLTAAHCFKEHCKGECSIQVMLISKPDYNIAMRTEHTSMIGSPFKLYSKESEDSVAYDIALIHFDPKKTEFIYIVTESNGKQYRYDDKDDKNAKEKFLKKIGLSPLEYDKAINRDSFPKLLVLKAETPKLLKRALIVPSIWGEKSEILSTNGYVYYSPQKHYLYTNNFGIRQGISGSGVFTDKGELVGIVSSVGSFKRVANTPLPPACLSTNYFFLSAFDAGVINFIVKNAGNVKTENSSRADMRVIPEECRDMALAIELSIN
jgi:hypothetical protein